MFARQAIGDFGTSSQWQGRAGQTYVSSLFGLFSKSLRIGSAEGQADSMSHVERTESWAPELSTWCIGGENIKGPGTARRRREVAAKFAMVHVTLFECLWN